jgi:hypothetical protein
MPYDSFYAGIQMQYELQMYLSYSMASNNNLICSNTIQSISNRIESMQLDVVNGEYLPCSTNRESLQDA